MAKETAASPQKRIILDANLQPQAAAQNLLLNAAIADDDFDAIECFLSCKPSEIFGNVKSARFVAANLDDRDTIDALAAALFAAFQRGKIKV